jgi:hypothetical protein
MDQPSKQPGGRPVGWGSAGKLLVRTGRRCPGACRCIRPVLRTSRTFADPILPTPSTGGRGLTPLAEIPQGCSSKFPTLLRLDSRQVLLSM